MRTIMTFNEYLDNVGRGNAWIRREDAQEFAPTFDALASETARAYRVYFHDGDHGARAENNMEVLTAEMMERYGTYVQVRKMGAPDASLVIYGSHAAWYNGMEPVKEVPLAHA